MTDDQYKAKDAELIRAEQEFSKAKQMHRNLEGSSKIFAAIDAGDWLEVQIQIRTKGGVLYQLYESDSVFQTAAAPATKLHPFLNKAVADYWCALRAEFSQL